ncbi:hypothetical protein IAT40_006440 [Kwoniella sp. CBS 6097]
MSTITTTCTADTTTHTSPPSSTGTDVTVTDTTSGTPGTRDTTSGDSSRSTAQKILSVLTTPTKRTKLSILNLDRYIARHGKEAKDPDVNTAVLNVLLRGARTIDLPVSEADELHRDHEEFSSLLTTMSTDQGREVLRQQADHICNLSLETGFVNKKYADRVRAKGAKSCGGYDSSGDVPVPPGYKEVPLTIFNIDTFMSIREELEENEDELNQEMVTGILAGETIRQPFPEHIADILLKKHDDAAQEVRSVFETRGEEEALRRIDQRLATLETTRQAWLRGSLPFSGLSSQRPPSDSQRQETAVTAPTDASTDAIKPKTANGAETTKTRNTRLNLLNLDLFIKRHQKDAKEPALRRSVLEALLGGSSTIELPVSEADELDSQTKKLSEIMASTDEKQANKALQGRTRDLLELSMATSFLDKESLSQMLGSKGSGGSKSAAPNGTAKSSGTPGYKSAPISVLNLDTYLTLPDTLKRNEDEKVQSAVAAALSGKGFQAELPDHVADILSKRHNDRVKELKNLQETKSEKEADKWIEDHLATLETVRQDWLGERLAPSDISMEPPPGSDTAAAASKSGGDADAARTDLVDTEVTFKNFDTFLNAYWTSNDICSRDTTDYLFEKYHPTRNRKIRSEIAEIWEKAGEAAAKVTVPSDLATALKKRNEEVATWLTDDLETDLLKSTKWRLGQLFHGWKKWKDTYKVAEDGKLGASTTSIPNITRRPVSEYTTKAESLDVEQARAIVKYAMDPSVKELSDDEFQLARETMKRSDVGFGKQGLHPEHIEALNKKRKLTWEDLAENDSYKTLRTACSSSVRSGAGSSSEDMPVAAPAA